jgi:pseudaminic acid biosynthesis-associated methylase
VKSKNPTHNQDDPLTSWLGSFGQSYIERNRATSAAVSDAAIAFRRILETAGILCQVSSVLEVGANIGINLISLRRVLDPAARLSAVEPNPLACEELRKNSELRLDQIVESDAYQIPLPDSSFDLTFTNGVLIHVPPDRLSAAMREITRISRRFVLCSEYFSDAPVEVPYRGQSGLLWKRDFGRAYLETCPDLKPRTYGFLWEVELPHFNNMNWWLFEKAR